MFSRKKKPASGSTKLVISSPIPIPFEAFDCEKNTKLSISNPIPICFDYEKNPLPPALNDYSTNFAKPIATSPSSTVFSDASSIKSHKSSNRNSPEPVPYVETSYVETYWRQPGNQQKQPEKKESKRWPSKSSPSPSSKGSSVTVPLVGKLKDSMFRNAGLDEHGRLKLDYEAVREDDWGTPEGYRRPSIW